MKILAVEFSSDERSVAVVEGTAVLGQAIESGGFRAIGLVEEALRAAGVEREQIGVVAVGIGPGSYTGIRGAIALAQGFELGLGAKLLGISSVACVAERARREQVLGKLNVLVDAQRNEFYLARYEIEPNLAREIEPLRLAPFAEIEALAHGNELIAGPGIKEWFPKAHNLFPDAAVLGCMACDRKDFVTGEKMEPIYLRETTFKKSPPWRHI